MRIFLDTANIAAKHPLTESGIERFLADWQKFSTQTPPAHSDTP